MINQGYQPSIVAGLGGLPKVNLSAPDCAQAEIYMHGAHVTSWIPAGGEERLFLSPKSEFRHGAAIRGGVPLIFPQFGSLGNGPRHGFARKLAWELSSLSGDAASAAAEFSLADDDSTLRAWPHPFLAKLKVSVGGSKLSLSLSVTNTGDEPFSFTTALHTYLFVENIQDTTIEGLHGIEYYDTVNKRTRVDWVKRTQTDPQTIFTSEVDRVYCSIPGPLRVSDSKRTTIVNMVGFPDVVVWNPGPERAASLADLGADGYRQMVCVEAAAIEQPVRLGPSETWQGSQVLSA